MHNYARNCPYLVTENLGLSSVACRGVVAWRGVGCRSTRTSLLAYRAAPLPLLQSSQQTTRAAVR